MAALSIFRSRTSHALRVVSVIALVLTSCLLVLEDSASASGGSPPGTLLATFDNPTGTVGQGFGNEVAISSSMAVADPAASSGKVFIYQHVANGGWPSSPSLTLTNPSKSSGGRFGTAIATNGPVLAVANTDSDNYSASTVDVYYYTPSGTFPSTPIAVLQAPNKTSDFGYSLAVWDGMILVGAPSNSGPGFAYIYQFELNEGFPKVATERDPANLAGDGFGDAVAIGGHTAVVASPGGAGITGHVYVYAKIHGWPTSPSRSIADPAGDPTDRFGATVSVSASTLNPTSSASTLAVGAPLTGTSAGADAGATYIYLKGSTAWPKKPSVSIADPTSAPSDFGASVALSWRFLLVCAPGANGSEGAAYIYKRVNAAEWPNSPTLTLSEPGTPGGSGQFCSDSSISTSIAFIGASNGDTGKGSAFVFKA